MTACNLSFAAISDEVALLEVSFGLDFLSGRKREIEILFLCKNLMVLIKSRTDNMDTEPFSLVCLMIFACLLVYFACLLGFLLFDL